MLSSGGRDAHRRHVLSRAAFYREVTVNKGFYIAAALILVVPWLLFLYENRSDGLVLYRQTLSAWAQTGMLFATFDLYVAAALGLALFGYDRLLGGLLASLEGPLDRGRVWLVKALLGGAVILAVSLLGTAALVLAASGAGDAQLIGPILLRALFETAGECMLFATALALSGAMSTVYAVFWTLTWMALPAITAGFAQNLLVPGPPWTMSLVNLSPFQPGGFTGWSTIASLGLMAGYAGWTALMVWLGPKWWSRAPFEHLRDGYFFPSLWSVNDVAMSLLVGVIVTWIITRGFLTGLGWGALLLALSAASWLLLFFVRHRIHGRRPAPLRQASS